MLNLNKKTGDTLTAVEVNEIGAAVDGLQTHVTKYNVSVQFPKGGAGGTNKYTKMGAIEKVPVEYRQLGMQIAYLTASGWEIIDFLGDNIDQWTNGDKWANTLGEVKSEVKNIQEQLKSESFLSKDYCVAAQVDGDLNPEFTEYYGDKSVLSDWDFYLLDATDNTRSKTKPVGKLKRNNLLRFDDGRFAPTVGISESQRSQCDVELYLDPGHAQKYCEAGAFNAEQFYKTHGMNKKLYNSTGEEITHILRPWETTEKKYTLGVGRDYTIYVLDNVKGKSGKIWSGIFKRPVVWDGVDVSKYPLAPTALSLGPVCTIDGKTRSFFYLYEGESNCKGSKGAGNACTMFFGGRTYPRVNDVSQISIMKYARANNSNIKNSYPYAEGGFHAYNAFLISQELYNGTKDLHNVNKFGSGISSNESCTNESTWKVNGGVRVREKNTPDWKYGSWGAQTSGFFYDATNKDTHYSNLINSEYPKEQCLESQMAASFAVETNVQEDVEFNFYGGTYWYKNVAGLSSLLEGGLNAKVYKRCAQTASFYKNPTEQAEFELEVILRMSLVSGVNCCGDVFAYIGGGYEQVGTCADPASASKNNPVALYMEPNQMNWVYEDTVTKNDLGKFDFESKYPKLGESVNLGDSYAAKRQSYAAWKVLQGGSLHNGQCFYTWDSNYWATTKNVRARIAVCFRGIAFHGSCSPRFLSAYYAVSAASRLFAGVAQALLDTAG